MNKPISFNRTREEARIIHKIAARAVALAASVDIQYTLMDADMDITAVHCNGCPLDLDRLLGADESNFAHDIFGIRNCLNRETGKLGRMFLPRFARKSSARRAA